MASLSTLQLKYAKNKLKTVNPSDSIWESMPQKDY